MSVVYIAEKPSLGQAIAANLPEPMKKKNGYIETGGGIVTWCYGHILKTYDPDDYDPKFKQWKLEDLPIVPPQWKLKVDPKCKEQFNVIKELLKSANEVVNAGDPDREGQLLVDEVIEHLKYKGPVKRVLINALDEKSVKDALRQLKNNNDFVSLRNSALARSRADWLVGMNMTRAYTIRGRQAGHSGVFNVGRVKTPTLGLVVRREREIANFKPIDYALVYGEYVHGNSMHLPFKAKWDASEDQEGLDPDGRLVDKAALERLLSKIKAYQGSGIVSHYETVPKKEAAPLPFSLSTLQVAAGKHFGYNPQKVLDTCQKLYEAKLTTYPRSDCEYLPESQMADISAVLGHLKNYNNQVQEWVSAANPSLKSRAWNDKQITAHHAIIPTTVAAKESTLSPVEQDIYTMIVQAYIAQFYRPHAFNKTSVKIEYAKEMFSASGRVVTDEGFRVLYKKSAEEEKEDKEEDATLPVMKKGDSLQFKKVEAFWKKTTPPKRFTESTLVQAMKDIHKYVTDPKSKAMLKSTSGIGTVATQASTIQDLIDRKFMAVSKKFLVPTEEAYTLIDVLPEAITLPDETALWEENLEAIQKKSANMTLDIFVNQLTSRLPVLMGGSGKQAFEVKHPCPECKDGVLIRRLGRDKKTYWWGCSNWQSGCKCTMDDDKGKPVPKQYNKTSTVQTSDTRYPCSCGNGYFQHHPPKNGKKAWWGCSNWKNGCKETRFDNKGKPATPKK